ncbi:MAG: hypothetical protein GY852_03740 [bacterium]|nr:hypothetical protein [bacterium]
MFVLVALALFLLEEIFHRKLGKSGRLSSMPLQLPQNTLKSNFDRFDLLRLLELLFLGLILSTAGGNPATAQGQLSMVLVGLQITRLFGRRVLSRWSVLGVVQVQEVLLMCTILILPLKPSVFGSSILPDTMLVISGGVLYGIFVSIAAAFSIAYAVKFYAHESGRLFDAFPPLADSEKWAQTFSTFSLFAGIITLAGFVALRTISVLSIGFLASFSMQFTGVLSCRKATFNGHHPVVHILWGISFVILYLLIVSGFTNLPPQP